MTQAELLGGKVAVVTGAARGIGRSCAEELSRAGASVVLIDRLTAQVAAVAQAITGTGGQAVALGGDLAHIPRVAGLIEEAEAAFGRIDILVNNAGISTAAQTEAITEEQWDQIMAINLKSLFFVTQAVLPLMARLGGGAVVNMGSIVARSGGVNSTVDYAASKAGVHGLTRTLARQYAPKGIRVNAVAPGPIKTDMINQWSDETLRDLVSRIPLGRLGTPTDVANVVVFLASPLAAYLTGVTIDIAGGLYMG